MAVLLLHGISNKKPPDFLHMNGLSGGFLLREGTSHTEMSTFPFTAARESAKLAKRILSGVR